MSQKETWGNRWGTWLAVAGFVGWIVLAVLCFGGVGGERP